MKIRVTKSTLYLSLFILFCLSSVTLAETGAMTPKDILDKVDDLFRGDSSTGKMTMTITTHIKSNTTRGFTNTSSY